MLQSVFCTPVKTILNVSIYATKQPLKFVKLKINIDFSTLKGNRFK